MKLTGPGKYEVERRIKSWGDWEAVAHGHYNGIPAGPTNLEEAMRRAQELADRFHVDTRVINTRTGNPVRQYDSNGNELEPK